MGFKTYLKYKWSGLSKEANRLKTTRNIFAILAAIFSVRRDVLFFSISLIAAVTLHIVNDFRRGEHTHWDRDRLRKKAEEENG
jgi:hypothetical protein